MKQITEDYCNKEVSTLLKEKGFDIPVKNYFSLNKDAMLHNLDKKYGAKKNWNAFEICISRPSQSIALKWLREMHNIHIIPYFDRIQPSDLPYSFAIYIVDEYAATREIIACFDINETLYWSKQEQAVKEALLYVLKNLI